MSFEIKTLAQRPDPSEQVHRLSGESWPTFPLHGGITHWGSLFDEFAGYQILFCEPADTLIAVGHTIPFVCNGTPNDLPSTMAGLMERAMRVYCNRRTRNTLRPLGPGERALPRPGGRRGVRQVHQDAENEGDQEPADFFRQVQQEDSNRAQQAKSLLDSS